jgi:hypothetical protein
VALLLVLLLWRQARRGAVLVLLRWCATARRGAVLALLSWCHNSMRRGKASLRQSVVVCMLMCVCVRVPCSLARPQDMEGACHCSVQPLSYVSDSELEDEPAQQQQQQQQQQAGGAAPPAGTSGTAAGGGVGGEAAAPGLTAEQQRELAARQAQEEEEAAAAAAAAATHHTQHEWQAGAALTVDSCMFAEVLRAEGVPQLTRYFCCQHNMSWLHVYQRHGVDSRLEACLARDDACCRLTVTPADGGS